MEPERDIEKQLRAYARKRRAQAGQDWRLPEYRRRQLLAAVARRQAEEDGLESISLWQLVRQHWGFLVGFGLLMFFGAALFLPPLGKSKVKAAATTSLNQLRQIGEATQIAAADHDGKIPETLAELTNNHLLPASALRDPVSGQDFQLAHGGDRLDGLSTNTVLVYSSVSRDRRNVLLADGSVKSMPEPEFAKLQVVPVQPTALPATAPVIDQGMAMNGNRQPLMVSGDVGSSDKMDFGNPTATMRTMADLVATAKDKTDNKLSSTSQAFKNTVPGTSFILTRFELKSAG